MDVTRPRATKSSQITIDSDWNLGTHALKFTDLLVKQLTADSVGVRNIGDTADKNIQGLYVIGSNRVQTDLVSELSTGAGIEIDGVECKDGEVYASRYIREWFTGSAAYDKSFSVAAQEATPQDVFFKPDGLKMYVVGTAGVDINEYDLTTAWDIATASYLQLLDVSGEEAVPKGIFFKDDGLKMYIIGTGGVEVNEYTLSIAWDVTSATATRAFDVSGKETAPNGISFDPTGAKMYVLGETGDDVNEYDLSTPWNISTAVWLQEFSVAGEEASPIGLFMSPQGTKMYISGQTSDKISQYNLSTPWDISTAVLKRELGIVTNVTSVTGIYISPDGSMLYFTDSAGGDVDQFEL